MDFYLPDNIEKLRIKTRNFVDKHIIPLEAVASSFDNYTNRYAKKFLRVFV